MGSKICFIVISLMGFIVLTGCPGQPVEEFLADEQFDQLSIEQEVTLQQFTRSVDELQSQIDNINKGKKEAVRDQLRGLLECKALKQTHGSNQKIEYSGTLCPVEFNFVSELRGIFTHQTETFKLITPSQLPNLDITQFGITGKKKTQGTEEAMYEGQIYSKASGTIDYKFKVESYLSGQHVFKSIYLVYYFKNFKALAKIEEVYFNNGARLKSAYFINREEVTAKKLGELFPVLF